MKVEDVMSVDVVTVRPDTPLKLVAELLVQHGISGLPVVNADGEVLGVVSEADLLVKEVGETVRKQTPLARLLGPDKGDQKVGARTAGEAMTSPALTIAAFRSVGAAAQEMLERAVNRLPVLRAGKLVGIVTRADLVRAFARTDEQIATDVRDQIEFFLALGDDYSSVEVEVEQGEVTLAGEVRRRITAEALPRLVGRIPGVVRMNVKLTWLEDDTHTHRAPLEQEVYPL